jgi:prepilin-type N-terminal cleavage/methylation domain-containing protein
MMERIGERTNEKISQPGPHTGGFTLIEVMIVVGILTFGLLALATMQIKAMHGGDRGRHATAAAAVAVTKMELIQQDPWASIPATTGFDADPVEKNEVKLYGGSSTFERDYNVSYQIIDLVAGYTRSVDVQVSWTEKGGENRSVTLSSVRFNRSGD